MFYFPLFNIFFLKIPFSFLILLYLFFNKYDTTEILKFNYKKNFLFYLIFLFFFLLIFKSIFFYNYFYVDEIFKLLDLVLFCIFVTKLQFQLPKKIHFYFFLLFTIFSKFLFLERIHVNENAFGLLFLFLAISSLRVFKSIYFFLLCLFFAFFFKTYTAALSIIFFLFLKNYIKFQSKYLLYLLYFSPLILFTIFYKVIYDLLNINSKNILNTILIRFSIWGNNLFTLLNNFETFLIGTISNKLIVISDGKYFNSSFHYTGIDPHNIFIKTFFYYGVIGVFLIFSILKRIFDINKKILLTFLLYWSFEPSLGSLQLFCIFYLIFIYNETYKIF